MLARFWWVFAIPALLVGLSFLFPDKEKIDLRNFSTTLSRALCEEGVLNQTRKIADASAAAGNPVPATGWPPISAEDAKSLQSTVSIIMDTTGWTAPRVKVALEHVHPGFESQLVQMSADKNDKRCAGVGTREERERAIRYVVSAYLQ
jgi:hypothetical protein